MNALSSRLLASIAGASLARRAWLAIGLALIVVFAALAVWFALRPSYEVMFSGLKRQDAAAVAAELEKQKIPFRYDEENAAILVQSGDTRATRLKLMSRDLRLQGVVGFELFNNSDLGLTEFAQKVNYQRALQGELARTIMTLDEIDLARVHITLPESSIFRHDNEKPKASVALFMRDGQTLEADAIRGIQRLVAASVPELSPADVAVLDARGAPASAASNEIDDPGLQLKQAIERSYERKIAALILSALGDGHASVSVEATINNDQVRATHEATVTRPLASDAGSVSTSVPLPSSRSIREEGRPPLPAVQASSPSLRTDSRTVRDLEQVVKATGAIRRLSVGIVLDHALPQDQMTRLTSVISTAIGFDSARGDVLSTFVREGHEGEVKKDADARTVANAAAQQPIQASPASEPALAVRASFPAATRLSAWLVCGALLLILLCWLIKRSIATKEPQAARLTDAQREQHAARLRRLLAHEETARE
ncbi:flagellar basal-body MS-ring/collar protein FliF [Caballeronia telluris]|uniref:Flagellar M-ring protein n=1 Tax=Caballeronia telluris TaxID=326475 RepID=A0A158ESW6_9BURK|nr:flagellar basal-body MS-ring/collar protein FliF [Caballeronia telluris]SAL10692.1 flagellar MS-ring protein [Caballeronia telluris]